MARYRVRDCGCIDWPCCEHADNFALTDEDAADCCCPYCGDPECFGQCEDQYPDEDDCPDESAPAIEDYGDTPMGGE